MESLGVEGHAQPDMPKYPAVWLDEECFGL